MKRILVAGGAGFIGYNLVRRLVSDGCHVEVIDSHITSEPKENEFRKLGVAFYKHDLRTQFDFLESYDEIYNLASPASPPLFEQMPLYILETAAMGHGQLLAAARDMKAKILYASSSEVYGESFIHPQPETYHGNVNPIGPRSCYDEGKRFGEALSKAYEREFQVSVRIARIFNSYGPYLRERDDRVISNLFKSLFLKVPFYIEGDGQQTRSFCYVDDTVDGLMKLMASHCSTPINIGNPNEITISELISIFERIAGVSLEKRQRSLPKDCPTHRCPDITMAKSTLGWMPKVDLVDGLKKTLQHYQQNEIK